MVGQDTENGFKMLVDTYSPPDANSTCPCCSGKTFIDCCQPLLEGRGIAMTAEQLMRSRYCAHACGQVQYIVDTWEQEQRRELDIDAIAQWALNSQWLGLQILTCTKGLAGDSEGTVEFVASFKSAGELQLHREISKFVRHNERWYFLNAVE